jgi:hypothetical protein
VAAGLFLASLAVLLVRWLVPGPIGAADNGDGWRLLCQLGAADPERYSEDWVIMAYPPVGPCGSAYVSTQLWLDQVAQWMGHQLGSTAVLNLYVLGALSCVLLAAAVTLVAVALPLPAVGRLVAAGLVLLVVADSAVFGWFVSVLSEGAAFLGVTAMVGGLLAMQRSDRWRYAGGLVVVAGGVVAVNAKAQTLLLLPALALALLLVRKTGRTLVRRWAMPVLVLALTASATAAVQRSGEPAGGEWAQVNAYNTIFVGILREETAAADLAAFGLPASFARYQGIDWFEPAPAPTDALWPQYQDRISRGAVARYYLEHPRRTLEILHDGARDLLTARPENIGSYPKSSGEPAMAQEFRVPVLSGITRAVAPLGLWALGPLWLLIMLGGLLSWRRARPVAVVVLFLLTAAVGQFVVAALGEGIEGVKHQVVALFCTLLAAAMAGIGLLVRRHASATTTGRQDRHVGVPDVEAPRAEDPDLEDAGGRDVGSASWPDGPEGSPATQLPARGGVPAGRS